MHISSESSGGSSMEQQSLWSSDDHDCTIDVIRSGMVVPYKIPSFSVITVQLRHIIVSIWSEIRVKHYDAILCAEMVLPVPSTIEILESCSIDVGPM